MHLLAILLAAFVAAAATPIVTGLAPAIGRLRTASVVPLAAALGAVLVWASSRIVTVRAPLAIALAVVAAVLAVQTVVDLAVHRLPREISYAGLLAFALALPFTETGATNRWFGALLGLAIMTAITAALVVVTRGSLGIGDLHLSPLLGALIGFFAPALIALAWVVTAFVGGVVVAIGLATRRLQRSQHVPYGPFMILGAIVAIVAGAMAAH